MARGRPHFAGRTDWDLEPNRLSRLARKRRSRGLQTLDLTDSNPTRCGFRWEGLALEGAIYEPDPKGLPSARKAVARYCGERVKPEHIVLTSGTSEAYGHLFRLLADPGDRVLVPKPGYPLFDFLARIHDVELGYYRLEFHRRWEIDFASLADAATERTRAVIVVHPNNPTGSLAPAGERQELARFCERRGLALIADEVFRDYGLCGPAESFAGERRALTFTLNGLSKTCALPQMKLGWIAASGPAGARDQALERLEVLADTYLSVNTPVQRALPELLGRRQEIQDRILSRIRANLRALDEILARQELCHRLPVEGGWSVVLRVPRIRTDEEWAIELLERDGVLIHPGHLFDFPGEGYLVASLIVPEGVFSKGISRLAQAVRRLAP